MLHLMAIALASATLLLRRSRRGPTREDVFIELFRTLALLYESASRMKPDWHAAWLKRDAMALPPKYEIGSVLVASAARDMRHATILLQRNRWKSVVEPLFAEYDFDAWDAFTSVSSMIASTLLDIGDRHADLLLNDERDWIQSAVEQFDEAVRLRRMSVSSGAPSTRVVAEGAYLPVYVAIQLSDRLIDRLRFEAGGAG